MKDHAWWIVAASAMAMLSAGALAGGQGSGANVQRKDPQAAVEPRSGPGAGQKYLEQFVGDWSVAKTFHPRAGEPSRAAGRCRQSMTQGGRFLQSDFTFGEGDGATTGTGLIGFEPGSGLFTSVWIDSRQTRMSFRRSREPFDGQRIVLHSASLDVGADEKDARRSRTVSQVEDGGRKIVHQQYNIGPNGEERLLMELVLRKLPKPAGAAP